MAQQTIWIDAELKQRLKVTAARTRRTMLELANEALAQHLEQVEAEQAESRSHDGRDTDRSSSQE